MSRSYLYGPSSTPPPPSVAHGTHGAGGAASTPSRSVHAIHQVPRRVRPPTAAPSEGPADRFQRASAAQGRRGGRSQPPGAAGEAGQRASGQGELVAALDALWSGPSRRRPIDDALDRLLALTYRSATVDPAGHAALKAVLVAVQGRSWLALHFGFSREAYVHSSKHYRELQTSVRRHEEALLSDIHAGIAGAWCAPTRSERHRALLACQERMPGFFTTVLSATRAGLTRLWAYLKSEIADAAAGPAPDNPSHDALRVSLAESGWRRARLDEARRVQPAFKVVEPARALVTPGETFLVSRKIAQGRHAKLKVGLSTKDGCPVAIRELRTRAKGGRARDGKWRTRPTRAAAVLGESERMLACSNALAPRAILRVSKNGKDKRRLCMVMPLMVTDLQHATAGIRQDTSAVVPVAAGVLCQVAEDLCALHRNGLVHGDVKPGNVMARGGDVCLADFGLVSAEGSLSRPVGPRGYFAPGRLFTLRSDTKHDIWSLGLVYASVICDIPFPRSHLGTVLAHRRYRRWWRGFEAWQASGATQDYHSRCPELDRFFNTLRRRDPRRFHLVCRMLHPHAAQRPSAETVLRELDTPELRLSKSEVAMARAAWQGVEAHSPINVVVRDLEQVRQAAQQEA